MKKKAIDFDALAEEAKASVNVWTPEELEIIVECSKRKIAPTFIWRKGLLPGRTRAAIDSKYRHFGASRA